MHLINKVLVLLLVMMVLIIPITHSQLIEGTWENGKAGFKLTQNDHTAAPELNNWPSDDDPKIVECRVWCDTNAKRFERRIVAGARLPYDGGDIQIRIIRDVADNVGKKCESQQGDDYCGWWDEGRHDIYSDSGPSGNLPLADDDYASKHRYNIMFKEPQNNNGAVTITATYNHEIGCNNIEITYHAGGDDFNPEWTFAGCCVKYNGKIIDGISEGNPHTSENVQLGSCGEYQPVIIAS